MTLSKLSLSLKKSILNRKPIYKYLGEKYGGTWRYDRPSGMWFCNEDERYACYVSNNFYNDGTYPESPPSLYIYGGDKPELVFL